MNNSKLVVHTNISPNKTVNRNHKIDTISIHCVVGQVTAETLGNIFKSTSASASSNYGVDKDGRIGMYVEEKDRSWCTSSSSNDNRAITIEVASDTTHPYKVNNIAYNALIDLCVDICKRNDIKELKWKADKSLIGETEKQNMTVHRWFANKACPGDYLYNLHSDIAKKVNERLNSDTQTKAPTLQKTTTYPQSIKGVQLWLNDNFNADLVVDNLYGTFTKKAIVKAFQITLNSQYNKNLIVDGIFGTKTKNAVINLKKGDNGDLVKVLQCALIVRIYETGGLDGIFGDETKKAVTSYQKALGLVDDGIAGKNTFEKLLR